MFSRLYYGGAVLGSRDSQPRFLTSMYYVLVSFINHCIGFSALEMDAFVVGSKTGLSEQIISCFGFVDVY